MKLVSCPTCGKKVLFAPENKFRPFCSERCSTLDLGAWAEEKYAVPAFDQESSTVNENENSSPTSSEEIPPKDRRN